MRRSTATHTNSSNICDTCSSVHFNSCHTFVASKNWTWTVNVSTANYKVLYNRSSRTGGWWPLGVCAQLAYSGTFDVRHTIKGHQPTETNSWGPCSGKHWEPFLHEGSPLIILWKQELRMWQLIRKWVTKYRAVSCQFNNVLLFYSLHPLIKPFNATSFGIVEEFINSWWCVISKSISFEPKTNMLYTSLSHRKWRDSKCS